MPLYMSTYVTEDPEAHFTAQIVISFQHTKAAPKPPCPMT